MSDHILSHRGFADIDPKQQKFPLQAGGAPEGILLGEPANEGANLWRDSGAPTVTRAGFPGPIRAKALAVPTYQGVGLEEMQCLETAGPNAVQPDPE